MVRRTLVKWRMCGDYINLNKACPNDPYLLPKLNRSVNAMMGHELLSFMDAFSGYNQIKMCKDHEEKTIFAKNQGVHFYMMMAFRLKNIETTYQLLVNIMFRMLIEKTMKV